MSEYELLQTENMKRSDRIAQYNNILYTSTAAILAFAFGSKNSVLSLISYVVIIPIYLIIEKEREYMCRAQSYMVFFLEGGEHLWETRLDMDDKMGTLGTRMPSADKSKFVEFVSVYSHWAFILIPLICSAFSTIDILTSNIQGFFGRIPKCIWVSAIWLWFFAALWIMIAKVTQWGQFRKKYTIQWRRIRRLEKEVKERRERYRIGKWKESP